MALHLPLLSDHFRRIATPASPRPISLSHLFGTRGSGSSQTGNVNLAEQVQQLAIEVGQQGQLVGEVAAAVTGKGGDLASAAESMLGGSVLGGLAQSAASGFSWQSILKDVFPLGGLISEVAGLFSSPAAPAALPQYDAPMPLNFSGVLGRDGTISQASGNARGQDRPASPGLDETDAAGGPQSAYTRLASGSLGPAAGAPSDRYSGVLDLSSNVRGLVQASAPAPAAQPVPTTYASAAAAPGEVAADGGTGAVSGNAESGGNAVPAFDGPWFMDHAPYIAAAVRTAMLDYHPIVDVVNDL